MYKLVALDLDGTLLDSKQEISEENKNAIRSAAEKGVRIVICSGRVYTGARVFARQICIRDPLITCNGAVIKDLETENLLYSSALSLEDCYKVIDLCHGEEVYFHAYIDETMYTERLEHGSYAYWKKNGELPRKDRIDIRIVKNMKRVLQINKVPAFKFIVVSDNTEQLARLRSKISKIEGVEVMSSNFDNFEVVNRGVNKGNALKILSERLGIEREEIIAMGDNENDFSMIKHAGLGIAMGNAEDGIKEIAGYITSSNDENGVAQALNRFVLCG